MASPSNGTRVACATGVADVDHDLLRLEALVETRQSRTPTSSDTRFLLAAGLVDFPRISTSISSLWASIPSGCTREPSEPRNATRGENFQLLYLLGCHKHQGVFSCDSLALDRGVRRASDETGRNAVVPQRHDLAAHEAHGRSSSRHG